MKAINIPRKKGNLFYITAKLNKLSCKLLTSGLRRKLSLLRQLVLPAHIIQSTYPAKLPFAQFVFRVRF